MSVVNMGTGRVRPISLQVAALKRRAVADLIREAVSDCLTREQAEGGSILRIAPHPADPS
jgi:hypothetical protein